MCSISIWCGVIRTHVATMKCWEESITIGANSWFLKVYEFFLYELGTAWDCELASDKTRGIGEKEHQWEFDFIIGFFIDLLVNLLAIKKISPF